MEKRVQSVIEQMTLEEKASLLSGKDFWSTASNDRLGIPSLVMSDGPHGLRKTSTTSDMGANVLPSTCFPTEATLASSWDTELVEQIGQAIAYECLALGVDVLLGPGVNIKRTPLGGRNFEHYSEDPFLSGELGASFVQGVQSKGVGACIKHFACNSQEYERMTISAEVDERTLRETYLPAFERVVRKAKPWMVMTSSNRINGVYAAEHGILLSDILKGEWGFEGAVVSDWGAVSNIERSVAAGLDLEMPGNSGYSQRKIIQAVREGRISEETIDEAVRRLLRLVFMAHANRRVGYSFDADAHHMLAWHAASESTVLLKNENNALPLQPSSLQSLAVIGKFAKEPLFQGIGSSQVTPIQLNSAYDAFMRRLAGVTDIHYADGYCNDDSDPNPERICEAARIAADSQAAVVFVGVAPVFLKEGRDCKHLSLPESHIRLIEEICQVQPRTIVVLASGSAVTMPWVNEPAAIVTGFLGGQASGNAIVDVLLGDVNPSGKLTETFPVRLEDTPAFLNYPGEANRVLYGEGSFIGYKYYDKANIKPLFPFGYGLSYTQFEYESMSVDRRSILDTESLHVSVTVRNTGERAGKEIVQLYTAYPKSVYKRPERTLKAFAKVSLQPGEAKNVTLRLEGSDCAFFDSELGQWRVESEEIELCVGSSSRTIHFRDMVYIQASRIGGRQLHDKMPFKAFFGTPLSKRS